MLEEKNRSQDQNVSDEHRDNENCNTQGKNEENVFFWDEEILPVRM